MTEKEGARGLTAWRIIIYAVLSFFVAAFQTALGGRIAFFGATPQLTLVLTSAAAYFYGPLAGAYVGLVSGVMTEAIGAAGVVTLPLFYGVLGWIVGAVTTEKSARNGFIPAFVSLAASCGAGMIFTVIRLVIGGGRPNIFLGLVYIALPEALNSFIFGAAIFALHALSAKILELSRKQKK